MSAAYSELATGIFRVGPSEPVGAIAADCAAPAASGDNEYRGRVQAGLICKEGLGLRINGGPLPFAVFPHTLLSPRSFVILRGWRRQPTNIGVEGYGFSTGGKSDLALGVQSYWFRSPRDTAGTLRDGDGLRRPLSVRERGLGNLGQPALWAFTACGYPIELRHISRQ